MKFHFTFILLLICWAILAQNNESKEKAVALYKAGKTLLQKKPLKIFDKIQALEQFQQCQKLLDVDKIVDDTLIANNKNEIQTLLDFFSAYKNSDSLLQLTQFYPDSLFQVNPRFSLELKDLIKEYLNLINRTNRKAFLNFRNLNYANLSKASKEERFIIRFENYWPLAVIEFDKSLKKNQSKLRGFRKKAREELLFLRIQHQLDSLRNQETLDYYKSNSENLLEKIGKSEKDTEAAISYTQRLKNIGLGSLGLLLLLGYFLWQKNTRLLRSKTQLLLEEKKRSEDLLSNMLPAEVVRQLKNKNVAKAQKYNSVCVLFSDFKNFSQISKNLPPEELVRELDYCFTTFDRIIDKYRLQKIKTIGDAYMCVGGLYTKGDQHIPRMVAAAFEIQQFLKNRKIQRNALNSYFFEARIGIHTGPVVAGVIGTKKIAFDVWGDTVNVAQQMEQHSEVGKVNISGETYELVKDTFTCLHRGEITVKNKKVYDMYFVSKKIS